MVKMTYKSGDLLNGNLSINSCNCFWVKTIIQLNSCVAQIIVRFTRLILGADIHSNALERKLMIGISKMLSESVFVCLCVCFSTHTLSLSRSLKKARWIHWKGNFSSCDAIGFSVCIWAYVRNKCHITYASIELKAEANKNFSFSILPFHTESPQFPTHSFVRLIFCFSVDLFFYSHCLNKYFNIDFSTQNPVK